MNRRFGRCGIRSSEAGRERARDRRSERTGGASRSGGAPPQRASLRRNPRARASVPAGARRGWRCCARGDADPEAVRYLNALCVRAYTHLQVSPRIGARPGTILPHRFSGDPGRDRSAAIAGRDVLLIAGALARAATLVARNPAALYACIPAGCIPPTICEQLVELAARCAAISRDIRAVDVRNQIDLFGEAVYPQYRGRDYWRSPPAF